MALRLGPLCRELVVIGGAVVDLLITDPGSASARPTLDVDVTCELHSTIEYYTLGDRLQKLGFNPAPNEPNICTWVGYGIRLDVLPSDPNVLGFSNPWYTSAIRNSQTVSLPSGAEIRIIDASHFVATKLVALADRGNRDIVISHDFEDIVLVLNGRSELLAEVGVAGEVKEFISSEFRILLSNRDIDEAIEGALAKNRDSRQRATAVRHLMEQISDL